MIEEQIPPFDGEYRVNGEDDGDEMCLESAKHTLHNIAVVHVRWHLLMFAIPFLGKVGDVRGAGFIVKNLKFDCDAVCLEAFHDVAVHGRRKI